MPPLPATLRHHVSAAAIVALGLACGASEERGAPPATRAPEFQSTEFFEPETRLDPNASGLDGLIDEEPQAPSRDEISAEDACVIDQVEAELIQEPVDIILLLDNSGSMDDEAAAVEANINVNFASVLSASGMDYRVIAITRHRSESRESSESASTSVCVQSPLSNLPSCESAPRPVFSGRYFQYSTKIESDDSFDVAVDTYAPPFESSSREERYDQAPNGWSAWLRPGAKKVFLEVTDDDEDMPALAFSEALQRLAPEHFGADPRAPRFVFHSIVGLAEKSDPTAAYLPEEPIVDAECTGNSGDVTSPGTTYQELSRMTGGLRFPLCQFDAYDVVFQRIAEDVVLTTGIACDFHIPEPPVGAELDLNNVAISYTPGGGASALQLGQVPTAEACQLDAFYIAENRLHLCPEDCTRVRNDPAASLTVLFTCENQLIVPR